MPSSSDRVVASRRAMDLGVAALLLIAGLVVMNDSARIGFRWASDGPQAGMFPFYVGVLLCASGAWSFARALRDRLASRQVFVTSGALSMILAMLLPTVVYVLAMAWLGLYVCSLAYIGFFMVWLGKYSLQRSVAVAGVVVAITFLLFEVWFKVPLPKGPLEAWLGLA